MTVEGKAHIALDAVGTLLKSEFIRGQGVFGSISRGAAVRHHEGAVLPVRCGSVGHELGHRFPLLGLEGRLGFDVPRGVIWRVSRHWAAVGIRH